MSVSTSGTERGRRFIATTAYPFWEGIDSKVMGADPKVDVDNLDDPYQLAKSSCINQERILEFDMRTTVPQYTSRLDLR